MDPLYSWIGEAALAGYLPPAFEHAFMVRGLLAALLVGPLLGGMGTMVVTRKLSFFTQTIGHAALTGVALGLLLGEPVDGTYIGLFGFCLIAALLTNWVRNRTRMATDTVIGVVLAQILGLGVVMLVLVTRQFNVHQIEAILFGSLITLKDADLLLLAGVGLAAAAAGWWLNNRTMLVSLNPAMAKVRGHDPVLLDYVFITVLTAVVVSSLKLVGALLVLVLVVVPAAGAQNLARGLRCFFWLSVVFATISSVAGLVLSGIWPVPTGAAIVLVATVLFYLTVLLRPLLGRATIAQGDA